MDDALDPDTRRAFNFMAFATVLQGAMLWLNGQYIVGVVVMLSLGLVYRALREWSTFWKGR